MKKAILVISSVLLCISMVNFAMSLLLVLRKGGNRA